MKRLVRIFGAIGCALGLALNSSGRILDNFDDNTKTGWQDFAFPVGITYSQIVEQNGQLKFTLAPVGQSIFAASTKTTETFELKEGRTIEFRIDLVSGNGPDSFVVLGFIPTSQSVASLAGYGFAKSETDILVTKGLGKYFYNQNPAVPIKNENVTLALKLTAQGGNVIINSRVLDKDANNAVLFEQTFIDTPAKEVMDDGEDTGAPWLGSGNFVLFCYEDNGKTQASYEITLDNAEVFVTDTVVLDDFNDNTKTAWQDFAFPVGITYSQIVEENGQFRMTLAPVGQSIFAASTKTSRTFDLVEGERVEFSVDLVRGEGADSFAVMAFIPTGQSVGSLAGYGFAKSTTDILVTKGLGKYFYNQNPPTPIKNENVTMVLSLTARGGNVYIDAKVLDKDANNAVLFQLSFVDTPAKDVMDDGEDTGAPWLGSGNFVLFCYEDNGKTQASYEVVYDNAVAAAAPLAANVAPAISLLSPQAYANLLPASTQVSFEVRDDKAIADSGIALTRNGSAVTEGVTLGGSGGTRTVTVANVPANETHSYRLTVTDSDGAKATNTVHFDTFAANSFVIEVEDYNFGGGQFIDNPVPQPEGSGGASGYSTQIGMPNVDYSDTRANFDDVPYRPEDHVRMRQSLDFVRAKFTAAGGAAGGVYDYDVGDIAAGEWLNYTRTFAPGSYLVYLREAVNNGSAITTTLEEVTSDPGQENQTTRVLGNFFVDVGSGFEFRNYPLQDGAGNPIVLNLSGRKTLRLRQTSGSPADGSIFQNYLIFIPTTGGLQRATVALLLPANQTTHQSVAPQISATIQNRDTTVVPGSIKLYVNGSPVTPVVAPNDVGASVTYSIAPLPAPGTTVQARLEFTDNQNVTQTNEWSFVVSYALLAQDLQTIGATGATRGIKMRLVQGLRENGSLENSLARAESQLAANSSAAEFVDTNLTVQVVNFNQAESDAGSIPGDQLLPGIDVEANGDDDFAVEFKGLLELAAGVYTFGVVSDDGFKIAIGLNAQDPAATPISFRNGGTANLTFDFVAPVSGLYPYRMVWYERGGGAHAEWFSVNRATSERTLINDPNTPSAIKSFIDSQAPALLVQSSATVNGTYANDSTAVIDTVGRRVTVPMVSGANRFFRVSNQNVRISSATAAGGTLTFSYQPQ